jgi:hypothetical protein
MTGKQGAGEVLKNVAGHLRMNAGDAYKGPDIAYRIVSAIPILLTNIVSTFGAYSWLHDNLKSWGTIGQVIFAVTFDSVAIFLALSAHHSQMRDDSALRLKIASRFFGALLGLMSGSHFLKNGHVTLPAIAVFVASASSPWLWSVYSSQMSRNALMAKGHIEPHALRMGASRWMFHPSKSFRVMSMASWTGEQLPGRAIAQWQDVEDRKELNAITVQEIPRQITATQKKDEKVS